MANNPDCDASSCETCCLACRLPSPARSSAAQSKTAKWRACSSRRLGAGRLAATVALRSSHDRNKGCGRPLSMASRRSSASKPPFLHQIATSTWCLAAASNSHRNLRPAAHALSQYPPWLPCSCSEGRQPISSCCWCGFARGGEVTRTRLGRHHPLVHGLAKVRHRDPGDFGARVFLSILTSRAGAPIWHRTISATRYTTRKCGRFGLCGGVGGGLSPMSRRIARISARMALRTGPCRACLSASASALKRDCARPRAAGSCGRRIYRNPPLGLTLILAFCTGGI